MLFKDNNDQKWNNKNEARGNVSFSQVFSVFPFLFLVLVLASACSAPSSLNENSVQSSNTHLSTTAMQKPGSQSTSPLKGVDWMKVIPEKELGCLPPANRRDPHGIQVDAKQFADVTGDGKAEAFVAVACVGSTESWPDRLEVFDGASNPAHPRRIAILLNYQDGTDGPHGLGLRIQSINIAGKHVVVVSKGWLPRECFACGDRRVTDTFTWNGSSFVRGPRTVTRMA